MFVECKLAQLGAQGSIPGLIVSRNSAVLATTAIAFNLTTDR
jgi:hypothetical protein